MPPKHAKALLHHGKAGEALKAGNVQMAMHHTGHVLSALRHGERSASLSAPPKAAPVVAPPVQAPPAFGGMRGRLSQMKGVAT